MCVIVAFPLISGYYLQSCAAVFCGSVFTPGNEHWKQHRMTFCFCPTEKSILVKVNNVLRCHLPHNCTLGSTYICFHVLVCCSGLRQCCLRSQVLKKKHWTEVIIVLDGFVVLLRYFWAVCFDLFCFPLLFDVVSRRVETAHWQKVRLHPNIKTT